MHILALVQGQYGDRIVAHIRASAPDGWSIDSIRAPEGLPPVVDDPEDFLPSIAPEADLLLALTESSPAAQLITTLAKLCGAKAVIAPIDNSAWLPPGLKNQIKRELSRTGATAVFPKTFCTLTESSAGFRGKAEPYENEYISSFARHFGAPRLKIKAGPEGRTIAEVTVERGTPCGSTHFTTQKMKGMPLDEVVPGAGLTVHIYPCSASMQNEYIDDDLFEPVMHISGYVMNDNIEGELEALRRAGDNP